MAMGQAMNRCSISRGRGYSLLEILLVTALVALLLSLAVPSYRTFMLRTYRVEAIAALMQVAACQERLRVISGAYIPGHCQPEPTSRYRYSSTPAAGQASMNFTITANPLNHQGKDNCGALSLDHNGFRSIENKEADVARCWTGR